MTPKYVLQSRGDPVGAGRLLRRLRNVGGGNLGNPEVRHDDQVAHGYPVQSPYVSIANRQAEIMMRIAFEFGFTPASRGRISVPRESEPGLFDFTPNIEEDAT